MTLISSLLILFFVFPTMAQDKSVATMGETVRLNIGEAVIFTPINYKLKLKSFKSQTSTCAVPGKNCGFGYFPGTLIFPEFDISMDKKCEAKKGPLPAECEVTHTVVETDNKDFVVVKFNSVFEPCEKEPNKDNRNSCFRLATKNSIYKPAYNPKNCDRITDDGARKGCHKEVTDKLKETVE